MATTQITKEITSLARFAVGEHNKKENARLEFVRAVDVTKHVVAGTEYHITVEATDDSDKKQYVAKVSESMGLKELLEFKPRT